MIQTGFTWWLEREKMFTQGCVRGQREGLHLLLKLHTFQSPSFLISPFPQYIPRQWKVMWLQNWASAVCVWTNRSGAASSSGLATSNASPLQACWVIIEAANENQRLTKAELMTSVLSSPSASPQQVTRCQKNTCQAALWEMKSCVWVGGRGCWSSSQTSLFPVSSFVNCWLWFVYSYFWGV